MPIQTKQQFERVLSWMQQNPDDGRIPQIQSELEDYIKRIQIQEYRGPRFEKNYPDAELVDLFQEEDGRVVLKLPSGEDYLKGFGQIAWNMIAGAAATSLAGLASLQADYAPAIGRAIRRDRQGFIREMREASDRIHGWADAVTFDYENLTETGQYIQDKIQIATDFLDDKAQVVAEAISESLYNNDPIATGTVKGLLLSLPGLFGAGLGLTRTATLRRNMTSIEKYLSEQLGINIRSHDLADQLQTAASLRRNNATGVGENLLPVREAVIRARDASRAEAEAAFRSARIRGNQAGVRPTHVQELDARLAAEIESDFFRLGQGGLDFAAIERLIAELRQIGEGTPDPRFIDFLREAGITEPSTTTIQTLVPSVKLNDLMAWRRRISRQFSRKGGTPQDRVLTLMMSRFDNWLKKLHDREMVLGNETALTEWRRAMDSWSEMRRLFEDDPSLRNFIGNGRSDLESLSSYIFNSSKTTYGVKSASTVRLLKEILGEDSPEFQSLRAETVFKMTEPLLRPEGPDYRAFIRLYDSGQAFRPSLMRELGIDQGDMRLLRDFSEAVKDQGVHPVAFFATRPGMDGAMIFSRLLIGNRLAKATLRQNFLAQFIRGLTTRTNVTHNRYEILREIVHKELGIDPKLDIFPTGSNRAQALLNYEANLLIEDLKDQLENTNNNENNEENN